MSLRNKNVGVIGLGAMGLPIAINLGKAGVPVQVLSRSHAPIDRAIKEGGVSAVSNAAEFDCAVVLSLLPGLKEIEELLINGLADALKRGDILVIMSTVSPVGMAEFSKKLESKGIRVVDAPMSGGDVGAWKKELALMVGGIKADYEDLLPTFEKIGQTIRFLGPIGSGQMAKACNQIVVATTLAALSEAITLGRKAGLDISALLDLLAGGLSNSQVLQIKRQKFETADYTPGGSSKFQLDNLLYVLEAGKATGTSLTVTQEVTALYQALIDAGDGAMDHTAVIREVERRSK